MRASAVVWLALALALALGTVDALPPRANRAGHSLAERRAKRGPATRGLEAKLKTEQWFSQQRLDHFDGGDTRVWSQRCFSNFTFYKPGGPVFMCVGGEGPALDPSVVVTGDEHCALMVILAKKHGALILALEHRFYGFSHPTPDLSTENLRFLSSQQALADLALFHAYISSEHSLPAETKWITFGGSYPGMLAAWARSKFPHLIHAAVSSSAPVQAVANMQGYNDVTAGALADTAVGGSAACVAAVQEAFHELGVQMKTPAGRRRLEGLFNVCGGAEALEPPTTWPLFSEGAADPLIPQSNDPACTDPACDIARQCKIMLGETSSRVHRRSSRWASVSRMQEGGAPGAAPVFDDSERPRSAPSALALLADLNKIARGGECLDASYEANVAMLQNTTLAGGWERVWYYQTCAEFGFYQTCDPGTKCPFTTAPHLNSLQTYYDLCQLAFNISGGETEGRVAETNAVYGGTALGATRILFVNGGVDPWRAQSVSEPRPDLPSIFVPHASHHFWTHPPRPSDTSETVNARVQIAYWVASVMDTPSDRAGHHGPSDLASHHGPRVER
ncbi:serine carboxypeptidase S28-domain-containing protein [Baffinella frigidus]|nr:serine carboxypeptidase S28-domain-containing protein [Cryptophyta sp. CCMP2293]